MHTISKIVKFGLVLFLLVVISDKIGAEVKYEKYVFELSLDFGTVCKFGKISWEEKGTPDEKFEITTSSLVLPTWGGGWGAPWSINEMADNGEEILSPPGRYLNLMINLSSPPSHPELPIKKMTIEYKPIYESGNKLLQVDLSKARLQEKLSGIPLSDKVVTPHVEWAKPYSRGKVRALFLACFDDQREVLELNQRMDLEFDCPTLIKDWNRWAVSTFYRDRLNGAAVMENLERLLNQKTYEVIVIGGVNWTDLSSKARQKILELVEGGTGIVIILEPSQIKEGLENVVPLSGYVPSSRNSDPDIEIAISGEEKGIWHKGKEHFITTGIPFEFLPETNYFKYSQGENILAEIGGNPLLAIGNFGQGRVVQLSYSTSYDWGDNRSLTPSVNNTNIHFPYWEYYLSLLGKSIIWVSKKESYIMIRNISPQGEKLDELDKKSIIVNLENTSSSSSKGSFFPQEEKELDVKVVIKDEFFNEEKRFADKITINAGSGERIMEFPIPTDLKAGLHFADISILNNSGKVENWGTAYFKVVQKTEIAKIGFDKDVYNIGDEVKIDVKLDNIEEGLAINLKLFDTYNRLIGSYEQNVTSMTVNFKYRLEDVLSHFIKAKCELFRNNQIIDMAESEFTVRLNHKWDDYEIIVWAFTGMSSVVDYIRPYYYEKLKEFGTTALLEQYNNYRKQREFVRNNFNIAPIGIYRLRFGTGDIQQKYETTKDKKVLVRAPCLSDPGFQEQMDRTMKDVAKSLGIYGPIGYSIHDENSLTSCGVPGRVSDAVDICFSEYCMKAFREWLKSKYQTLENLNAEWGSSYKKWDEIYPSTKEEVKGRQDGNYSSWADHRTFMEDVFAGTYKRGKKDLLEEDSNARIGVSGTAPPSPYTGFDYWKLGQVFDYLNMYTWVSQGEIPTSFFPNKFYTHWTGYGQEETQQKYNIWWPAFHEHKGISFWKTPFFIHPDLTLSEHGLVIQKSIKDLKEGIGKILINSEKMDDKITIHYSQPSLHAAWITGEGKPMTKASKYEFHEKSEQGPGISWDEVRYIDNLDTYCKILEGAGFQYRFVSYEQVEKGELLNKGYKALILPFSQAISLKEIEEIKKFVKDGGLLIADVLPGVMDDHCKTQKVSLLSDVFGAEIMKADYTRTPGKIEMAGVSYEGTNLGDYITNEAVGTSTIKVTTGMSLAEFEKEGKIEKTVVINKYGKGKAVYLNFFLSNLYDYYTWQRDSNLLSLLLKSAGINSKIKIKRADETEPLPYYEATFFKDGLIEYLGVLRDYKMRVGKDDEEIEIILPEKSFIYDVRKKRFIGLSNNIKGNILPGDAGFYALLPYKIKGAQVKTDKDTYEQGDFIKYHLKIESSAGETGNHIVKLEVYNPDNKMCSYYSKNVSTNKGEYSGVIRLSLNELVGNWNIKARDVISGEEGITTFKIKN